MTHPEELGNPSRWGEIHYEHPTPDEIKALAEEIEAIRSLLTQARSRLFWASRPHDPSQFDYAQVVGFRSGASDDMQTVEKALTPLISFLYPHIEHLNNAAEHKRSHWPSWLEAEGHVCYPGWAPEDRPQTRRGCIVRVPAKHETICGNQMPCPDHPS